MADQNLARSSASMTAAELIRELQCMPPDAPVMVEGDSDLGSCPVIGPVSLAGGPGGQVTIAFEGDVAGEAVSR